MINFEIDTSKLYLAQVRYYETERNGVEITDLKAYAFLAKVNGAYINILNPVEELPVYNRLPYSNTTRDGIDYGNIISLVCGDEKDGPCFVIENVDVKKIFGQDTILLSDVENYVLNSDLFFVDRIDLMSSSENSSLHYIKSRKKLNDDIRSLSQLKSIFSSHENAVSYKK